MSYFQCPSDPWRGSGCQLAAREPPSSNDASILYEHLTVGQQYTFTATAIDEAGNADPTPLSFTFTYRGPIQAVIDADWRSPTRDTTPTFKLSGATSYECILDDNPPVACPPSYTTPELPEGNHTLSVTGLDASGIQQESASG